MVLFDFLTETHIQRDAHVAFALRLLNYVCYNIVAMSILYPLVGGPLLTCNIWF